MIIKALIVLNFINYSIFNFSISMDPNNDDDPEVRFEWNDHVLNRFANRGNQLFAEAARPIWIRNWPMTAEGLKLDLIVAIGSKGSNRYNFTEAIIKNTPIEVARLSRMIGVIESSWFMQQIMLNLLGEDRHIGKLAKIILKNPTGDPIDYGVFLLEGGFVPLFN